MRILIIAVWCLLITGACQKMELYEYPTTTLANADITALTLTQEGQNVVVRSSIDPETGTITLVVRTVADITKLVPRANVADGATIAPAMGVYNDFSSPVTYTVTSGNRQVAKAWTISVSKE